jgi:adenine C2-methylase RlmN of 23S rRNA A2503 and tRNA A37
LELLRDAGVRAYLRTPRGDDIGAACGQLALQADRGANGEEAPA